MAKPIGSKWKRYREGDDYLDEADGISCSFSDRITGCFLGFFFGFFLSYSLYACLSELNALIYRRYEQLLPQMFLRS